MMQDGGASLPPFRPDYRGSGLLLHVTSLPSRYGVGDAAAARSWIDRLAAAGQSWWQSLPLGPTGYGNSPYQPLSSFAGNGLLVSPDWLIEDGLLRSGDCQLQSFPEGEVDYDGVIPFKHQLLEKAWANFQAGAGAELRAAYEQFCHDEAHWLNDYALFRALKAKFGGAYYLEWPKDLVEREAGALDKMRRELADQIGLAGFIQFLLCRQADRLRDHARSKGVWLIGDLPFFVSPDSSDVWAYPEIFLLDEQRRPTFVAGVPPDYFSATGQLWGNPVYDWDALRASGYRWWIGRLRALLRHVDVIRLDHFRGFTAAWHVPAGAPTAQTGSWKPGPGAELLDAVQRELGSLHLIAEDLGQITPDVYELRDRFHLPGMRVLQFAFDGHPDNPHLPDNYVANSVVYTGTHDNPTTREWFDDLADDQRQNLWRYLKRSAGTSGDAACGIDGFGLVLAGGSGDGSVAGFTEPGEGSSYERARPRRRQLAVAVHGEHARQSGFRMGSRLDKIFEPFGRPSGAKHRENDGGFPMKATKALHDLGQSIWLDNITRDLLGSGTLKHYIDEWSVTGLTSNPTIFDHAIKNSAAYDSAIREKLSEGKSGEALFFELALEDITRAAALFRPIHDRTDGVDGWVSLEVSPLLAYDTASSLAAARSLHAQAGQANLFIKIPGTKEGLPAIEEAIFAGIPVNVTLLFSREQYVAAADAFLRGVERRIESGLPPVVGSVASIFISRWDVAVTGKAPDSLRDQLGIAVAKRAYKAYCDLLASARWQRALNFGARPQRLLWASTGTKDPKASDVLYVKGLAAPFTVNTMPDGTLKALADHGEVGAVLPADGGDCEEVLAQFAKAGVDVDALAVQLQEEGAASFVKSWNELMSVIDSKSAALRKAMAS